jgi:hypothetical protein
VIQPLAFQKSNHGSEEFEKDALKLGCDKILSIVRHTLLNGTRIECVTINNGENNKFIPYVLERRSL